MLLGTEEIHTQSAHTEKQSNGVFVLLAIINWGSGLDESTDQRLQPPSPAPRGGTEALGHRRAVLVEKRAEGLVRNQDWGLAKQNNNDDNS